MPTLRQLRYMGQRGVKHEHLILGYQERLDEVQGALLSVKLRYLDAQLAGRQRVADRYVEMLADTPSSCRRPSRAGRHANYMYTVHVPQRDDLRAFLERARRRHTGRLPQARAGPGCLRRPTPGGPPTTWPWPARLVARILCLPMFAELTDEEIDRVGSGIRDFYGVR